MTTLLKQELKKTNIEMYKKRLICFLYKILFYGKERN